MYKVNLNGSICIDRGGGCAVSTETSLDLHWENTEGVVRLVDNISTHFPYLQLLNLEGQRVSDVSALGSLLSLRELIVPGNCMVDATPLSSCLLLTKLDLNDNMLEDIPPGFRSLVMLQQLCVAGNQIAMLSSFDALASLPALTDISVSRNPVSALANCEENLVARLRQLESIDGKAVSQHQRQAATMQAAKNRLEQLEQQVSLQDSHMLEMSLAGNRKFPLKDIERLLSQATAPHPYSPASPASPPLTLHAAPSAPLHQEQQAAAAMAGTKTKRGVGYLPVMLARPRARARTHTHTEDSELSLSAAPTCEALRDSSTHTHSEQEHADERARATHTNTHTHATHSHTGAYAPVGHLGPVHSYQAGGDDILRHMSPTGAVENAFRAADTTPAAHEPYAQNARFEPLRALSTEERVPLIQNARFHTQPQELRWGGGLYTDTDTPLRGLHTAAYQSPERANMRGQKEEAVSESVRERRGAHELGTHTSPPHAHALRGGCHALGGECHALSERRGADEQGAHELGPRDGLRELVLDLMVVARSVFIHYPPPFCDAFAPEKTKQTLGPGRLELEHSPELVVQQLIALLPLLSAPHATAAPATPLARASWTHAGGSRSFPPTHSPPPAHPTSSPCTHAAPPPTPHASASVPQHTPHTPQPHRDPPPPLPQHSFPDHLHSSLRHSALSHLPTATTPSRTSVPYPPYPSISLTTDPQQRGRLPHVPYLHTAGPEGGSPSPLAREIQERFEQYQRTMREYDQFVRGGAVGGAGTMGDEYSLSAGATQGAAPEIRGTTQVQKDKGKGSAAPLMHTERNCGYTNFGYTTAGHSTADIDANLERMLRIFSPSPARASGAVWRGSGWRDGMQEGVGVVARARTHTHTQHTHTHSTHACPPPARAPAAREIALVRPQRETRSHDATQRHSSPGKFLNVKEAGALNFKVATAECFDRDSCHRPLLKNAAPAKSSTTPGLELLQRKGGKGVKSKRAASSAPHADFKNFKP